MPSVRIRENEPFEYALRRFKRSCEKAGILSETRRREYYEKPTRERKRKKAAAVKRHLRRMSREVTRRTRLVQLSARQHRADAPKVVQAGRINVRMHPA